MDFAPNWQLRHVPKPRELWSASNSEIVAEIVERTDGACALDLKPTSTTMSAVSSRRSARFVWAFSMAVEMLSFVRFWAPMNRAVLAL